MTNLIQDPSTVEPPRSENLIKDKVKDIAINIILGQIIAVGISSGGVFTENIQNRFQLNIPILLLCFIYAPLTIYLFIYFCSDRRNYEAPRIPIKWFLLCAIIDVHTTMLIVYAFNYTSITSVMLL